jgi:hypothetical protein
MSSVDVTLFGETLTLAIPAGYVRPTGPNFQPFETLPNPSSVTPSLLIGTSTKALTFAPGDFTALWADFAEAAGYAGAWWRNADIWGSGVDKTFIGIKANSGTKTVPTSGTNQYNLARVDGATGMHGLTITGTPQAKTKEFNGLLIYKGAGSLISDVKVKLIIGSGSAPPNETFGANNNKSVGVRFLRFESDGSGGGASGFGDNSSSGTILEDAYCHDSTFAAGAAFYKTVNAQIVGGRFLRNAKVGINFEQITTATTLTGVEVHDTGGPDISITSNLASAPFRIIEPKLFPGQILKIRVSAIGYLDAALGQTSFGTAATSQKQRWSDILVTLGGVTKPADQWPGVISALTK